MRKPIGRVLAAFAVPLLVAGISATQDTDTRDRRMDAHADPGMRALRQIDHIVVIYQENWSFGSLFGLFPGADGIANALDGNGNLLFPQVSKTGAPIATLPAVKG